MEVEISERYINPYTDFGFKKLFGTELNKDLLISFLNALFNDKPEITAQRIYPVGKVWLIKNKVVPLQHGSY